jgi:hypothetical protein
MKRLIKISITHLCIILLFSSYSFAQYYVEFATIKYKGEEHYVVSNMICLDIKENFYNSKLLDKIEKSGYKIISAKEKYRKLLLQTDVKSDILEHYYKFEKEEYVEKVLPYHAIIYHVNDPAVSYQYYFNNISMSSAWGITSGSTNVKIGVPDGGIPIQYNKYVYNNTFWCYFRNQGNNNTV